MSSSIGVTISGAADSQADYDDQSFLAADQAAREALVNLYEAGATVENIAEAVQGALADAGAAV